MPSHTAFASGHTNRSCPESTVIPVLYYPDVHAAAKWLCAAFGFTERLRVFNHRIQMNVGEGSIVVADGPGAPPADDAVSVSIMIRVQNVDEVCERAIREGAVVLTPLATHMYGERQCTLRDFASHKWTFSQSVDDVDPAAWGGEMVSG